MNDTVKCDGGLYKSLQAWKDHKLHIEHEVLLPPSAPCKPIKAGSTGHSLGGVVGVRLSSD